MENKAHALAAGIFVVAITALLIVMAWWLTRDVANTVIYQMTSSNPVTGLQVQAAVRFKGVSVGKVTRISFDPAERGNVLVTVAVNPRAPVTESTFATLAFQGVTGLSFVQLDDDGSSTTPPPAGPDGVPRIPLRPNALGQLSDQASQLVEKVDRAADRLNLLLGPENQAALQAALKSAASAAASAEQLANTADRTLRAQLDPSRVDLPALVRQAGATLKATEAAALEVRGTMASLNAVATDARQSLVRITGPGGLVDRLDEGVGTVTATTLPSLQQLGSEAGRTLRRVDRLAGKLDENPQALVYGGGPVPPGPGEPGFVVPTKTGNAASR